MRQPKRTNPNEHTRMNQPQETNPNELTTQTTANELTQTNEPKRFK